MLTPVTASKAGRWPVSRQPFRKPGPERAVLTTAGDREEVQGATLHALQGPSDIPVGSLRRRGVDGGELVGVQGVAPIGQHGVGGR